MNLNKLYTEAKTGVSLSDIKKTGLDDVVVYDQFAGGSKHTDGTIDWKKSKGSTLVINVTKISAKSGELFKPTGEVKSYDLSKAVNWRNLGSKIRITK
jgi:hypothetical protein